MKKKLLSGMSLGLAFAGIASLIAKFNGFNSDNFMIFLYLYVILGGLVSLKSAGFGRDFLPGILHRIVVVAEGEELKMKKLVTGEKYRVKGDIEKI